MGIQAAASLPLPPASPSVAGSGGDTGLRNLQVSSHLV